jgi:hypothetical protein
MMATGCAIHRVRVDFTGFEKAYADTSNRELLLNLARLQNHDPTYFFKMGQITSAYRMVANLSTNGSYVIQGTTPGGGNGTGGGTPGLSYESDPVFQFIPVNDETNAQLLLKPIPAETFYILYEQGWRIDQILRLMVDRIEVTTPTPGGVGCNVKTYRNIPPVLLVSGDTVVPLDPEQLQGYSTFLRISAIAYGLQRHGDLLLRGISTFVPLDPNAVGAGASQRQGGGASLPAVPDGISAADIEKAAEKNLTFESVGGVMQIGQRIVAPKFYLIPPKTTPSTSPTTHSEYEPDIDAIETVLGNDQHLKALKEAQVLKGFLNALHDGFTIEGDTATPQQAVDPCPVGKQRASVHLVLRSLIGVMAAAAQEQKFYDVLGDRDMPIPPEPDTPALTFNQSVPDIERIPILRIHWASNGSAVLAPPAQPLIELSYRDTHYLIADPKIATVPENEYWNRDVFRLIAALTAQVTVDISKYSVPDILQLHAN